MEQNTGNVIPVASTISEKLRDTDALNKVVKQAVIEAVDKARKLGFLPTPSAQETLSDTKK